MKNPITITILFLLLSMSQAWGLPPCEGEESIWNKWQNCEGSLTSHSGTIYVGVFKDGIFEGKNEDRNVEYKGEYKDGIQNGQGTYTLPDGGTYVGDVKDSKFHGQGVFTFPDGGTYVGEYKDGRMYGQGTQTLSDGTKYVGQWKDDLTHGQGTITFTNGEKHVGEYKDGMANGQGTKTLSNGEKYVGQFKNNQYHGKGTYTYSDGEKLVGEFKDGIPTLNTTLISSDASADESMVSGRDTSLPSQQQFLIDITNRTLAKIDPEYNDAKVKSIWIKASKELCSSRTFNAFRKKSDFIGYVTDIMAHDNGSMGIAIRLTSLDQLDSEYKVSEAVVDESLNEIILELNEGGFFSEGDKVKFSGYFKKGKMSQNECLDPYISFDSQPEFAGENFDFEFTKIEKI